MGGLDLLCTRRINVISKETAAQGVFTLCVCSTEESAVYVDLKMKKNNPKNKSSLGKM